MVFSLSNTIYSCYSCIAEGIPLEGFSSSSPVCSTTERVMLLAGLAFLGYKTFQSSSSYIHRIKASCCPKEGVVENENLLNGELEQDRGVKQNLKKIKTQLSAIQINLEEIVGKDIDDVEIFSDFIRYVFQVDELGLKFKSIQNNNFSKLTHGINEIRGQVKELTKKFIGQQGHQLILHLNETSKYEKKDRYFSTCQDLLRRCTERVQAINQKTLKRLQQVIYSGSELNIQSIDCITALLYQCFVEGNEKLDCAILPARERGSISPEDFEQYSMPNYVIVPVPYAINNNLLGDNNGFGILIINHKSKNYVYFDSLWDYAPLVHNYNVNIPNTTLTDETREELIQAGAIKEDYRGDLDPEPYVAKSSSFNVLYAIESALNYINDKRSTHISLNNSQAKYEKIFKDFVSKYGRTQEQDDADHLNRLVKQSLFAALDESSKYQHLDEFSKCQQLYQALEEETHRDNDLDVQNRSLSEFLQAYRKNHKADELGIKILSDFLDPEKPIAECLPKSVRDERNFRMFLSHAIIANYLT